MSSEDVRSLALYVCVLRAGRRARRRAQPARRSLSTLPSSCVMFPLRCRPCGDLLQGARPRQAWCHECAVTHVRTVADAVNRAEAQVATAHARMQWMWSIGVNNPIPGDQLHLWHQWATAIIPEAVDYFGVAQEAVVCAQQLVGPEYEWPFALLSYRKNFNAWIGDARSTMQELRQSLIAFAAQGRMHVVFPAPYMVSSCLLDEVAEEVVQDASTVPVSSSDAGEDADDGSPAPGSGYEPRGRSSGSEGPQ